MVIYWDGNDFSDPQHHALSGVWVTEVQIRNRRPWTPGPTRKTSERTHTPIRTLSHYFGNPSNYPITQKYYATEPPESKSPTIPSTKSIPHPLSLFKLDLRSTKRLHRHHRPKQEACLNRSQAALFTCSPFPWFTGR